MSSHFGIIILCDVIYRDTATNKSILAGVYSGNITMDTMPAPLRFCVYSEFWTDRGGLHDLELRLLIDGVHIGGVSAPATQTILGDPAIISSPTIDIVFPKPAEFEIKGIIDGGRAKSLLKKRVLLV